MCEKSNQLRAKAVDQPEVCPSEDRLPKPIGSNARRLGWGSKGVRTCAAKCGFGDGLEMGGYLIFYSGYQTLFFFGQKQLGHTLWNFTALLAEAVVLGDRGLEFSGHVDDLGIISSLSRLGLSKYTKLQWLVITLIALFGGCPVCHFHFLFDLAGKIQVSGIPLKFLPSITP